MVRILFNASYCVPNTDMTSGPSCRTWVAAAFQKMRILGCTTHALPVSAHAPLPLQRVLEVKWWVYVMRGHLARLLL